MDEAGNSYIAAYVSKFPILLNAISSIKNDWSGLSALFAGSYILKYDTNFKLVYVSKVPTVAGFTPCNNGDVYAIVRKTDLKPRLLILGSNGKIKKLSLFEKKPEKHNLPINYLYEVAGYIMDFNGNTLDIYNPNAVLSDRDKLLDKYLKEEIQTGISVKETRSADNISEKYYYSVNGFDIKERIDVSISFTEDENQPFNPVLLGVDNNLNTYIHILKQSRGNHHPLYSDNIYIMDKTGKYTASYSFLYDYMKKNLHQRVYCVDKKGNMFCLEQNEQGVFLNKWNK